VSCHHALSDSLESLFLSHLLGIFTPLSPASELIMTERERWIVYPLLFLALGAALRDKFVDPTVHRSIICQELTVVDDDSDLRRGAHVLAKIGHGSETTAPGYLVVNGPVEVAGTLNASEYAINGHPLTPIFQAMFEFLRLVQAAQQQQLGAQRVVTPPTTPPAVAPPAVKSNDDASGAPSDPKSDDDSTKAN
jgi:hypothetical protein